MNRVQAMQILGVQEPLRPQDVRRAYRRAALKHHPDKGGSPSEFHKICDAHDVLQSQLGTFHRAERDYSTLVKDFLRTAMGGDGGSMLSALGKVASDCKAALQSLSSLRDLDSQTCLSTLAFLEKHAGLLHIDVEAIHAARARLHLHQQGRPRFSYTLNATLDHMLGPDVYKLQHRGEELLVPLWHEDLLFDTEDGIVNIRCVPTLPANITVDVHNNLHVHVTQGVNQILDKGELVVVLGGREPLRIPCCRVTLERTQTIRCTEIGIPLINLKDVYHTGERGDVLVHLTLSSDSP